MNTKLRGAACFWLLLGFVVPAIAGELDLHRIPSRVAISSTNIGPVTRIQSSANGERFGFAAESGLISPLAPRGGLFWFDRSVGSPKFIGQAWQDGLKRPSFDVTPDGALVAYISLDKVVRLYHPATDSQESAQYGGKPIIAYACALSADGRYLAYASVENGRRMAYRLDLLMQSRIEFPVAYQGHEEDYFASDLDISDDGSRVGALLFVKTGTSTYSINSDAMVYDFYSKQTRMLFGPGQERISLREMFGLTGDGTWFATQLAGWNLLTDERIYWGDRAAILNVSRNGNWRYELPNPGQMFQATPLGSGSAKAVPNLNFRVAGNSDDLSKVLAANDTELRSVNLLNGTSEPIIAPYQPMAANSSSAPVGMSRDNRTVYFSSAATNILAGTLARQTRVYRESLGSNGPSLAPWSDLAPTGSKLEMNRAGTFVVAAKTDADDFLFNIETGAREQLPNLKGGRSIDVSADGRYVILQSTFPLDNEAFSQEIPFLWDRLNGKFSRIVKTFNGSAPNGGISTPLVSDDGKRIVFGSTSTDFVGSDSFHSMDVFVHDTETGETKPISHPLDDPGSTSSCTAWDISADAAFVFFRTPKLLTSDAVAGQNIYRYTWETGEVDWIAANVDLADVSQDGKRILTANSVVDVNTGQIWPIERTGFLSPVNARFSPDGEKVIFSSNAPNLPYPTVFVFEYGPRTKTDITAEIHDSYVGPVSRPELRLDFRGVTDDPNFVLYAERSGTDVITVTAEGRGTYLVFASEPGFLRRQIGMVSLDGQPVSLGKTTLLAGDVYGDNTVSLFDYLLLSDAYESVWGDQRYILAADFDRDGVIDLFDYFALSENFDKTGDS